MSTERKKVNYRRVRKERAQWVARNPKVHPGLLDELSEWVRLTNEEAERTEGARVFLHDAFNYCLYFGIKTLRRDVTVMKDTKRKQELRNRLFAEGRDEEE